MTEIIEKAKELGALLQASEQVQKYNAAKDAYEKDEGVQKLIKEFNMHRMTMANLADAEDQDPSRIAEIEERIKAVYGKIMEKKYAEFEKEITIREAQFRNDKEQALKLAEAKAEKDLADELNKMFRR